MVLEREGFMKTIKEELCNSILEIDKSSIIEISESILDGFIDDSVLKNIPIVNVISSMYKTGKSISEYRFIKKILLFINEINRSEVNEDKIKNIKFRFEKEPKYKDRVLESILFIIDRLDNEMKSRILARLFIQYIDEQYSWDEFQDFSRIIESFFIVDLKLIRYLIKVNQPIYIKNIHIKNIKAYTIKGSIERLKTYGFLELLPETWGSVGDSNLKQIKLNSEGSNFYNKCLHNIVSLEES